MDSTCIRIVSLDYAIEQLLFLYVSCICGACHRLDYWTISYVIGSVMNRKPSHDKVFADDEEFEKEWESIKKEL